MNISVTAREIMDKGLWEEFCHMKGLNEWCVNEGRLDAEEPFLLTEEEAKKLKLIKIK